MLFMVLKLWIFLFFLYSGVILYLYTAVCNREREVVFKHKSEMWSLFSFQEDDLEDRVYGFAYMEESQVGHID